MAMMKKIILLTASTNTFYVLIVFDDEDKIFEAIKARQACDEMLLKIAERKLNFFLNKAH